MSVGADEPRNRSPSGELTTSSDGIVLNVNATVLRWLGLDRAAVVGRPLPTILSAASQLYYETRYRTLLQLNGRVDAVALELRAVDGRSFPVVVDAEEVRGPGTTAVVRLVLFPAGRRAAYERHLRQSQASAQRSEARLRLLYDLRDELRSAVQPQDVARALARALTRHTRGGSVAVWLTRPDGALALEVGDPVAYAPTWLTSDAGSPSAQVARNGVPLALRAGEARERFPTLARALAEAGRELLLLAPLSAGGEVLGVVQIALRRERPDSLDELDLLAAVGREAGRALLLCGLPGHRGFHDPLTGSGMPALLSEWLGPVLARSADSGEPLSVFLLEVLPRQLTPDLPTPLSDAVLVELGLRLHDLGNGVARVGRQRFLVQRERCPPAEARRWAALLQHALEQAAPSRADVTVTVGGVVVEPALDGRSVTVRDVLAWVSTALDAASALGPGRSVLHPAAKRQAANVLAQAERVVRRALQQDGVVVHYQPVVHLRTGRVIGVEALSRLRLPDGSLLQPTHFINAAEDSGLLVPLGRRALEIACRQQASWASAGDDLDVAVNVAASQAADPTFADVVMDVLETTGCTPQNLVLELTESALLAATPSALGTLAALRDVGVRVALDDFGTRYASLDYVRRFTLDELKIDQSFVAGLPGGRVARAIVRMVAQLAQDLDLVCVAEGIETVGQAKYLSELGVLGQGFVVGRPVPSERVVPWLTPASWLAGAGSDSAGSGS